MKTKYLLQGIGEYSEIGNYRIVDIPLHQNRAFLNFLVIETYGDVLKFRSFVSKIGHSTLLKDEEEAGCGLLGGLLIPEGEKKPGLFIIGEPHRCYKNTGVSSIGLHWENSFLTWSTYLSHLIISGGILSGILYFLICHYYKLTLSY